MSPKAMTPKERWLAVLNREEPDRIPMDYWATAETTTKLTKHLGCSDHREVLERLHIDRPMTPEPKYVGPTLEPGYDMHGCGFRDMNYGTGIYRECIYHPLAEYDSVEEIDSNYVWPSADWFDYSALPRQVTGHETRPVRAGGSEPFLIYKQLRGDEQAFIDLIMHPDIVHYCMEKLYGSCYENTRRIYEQIPGKVMVTGVAEDMGAQDRLLYSREHLEEYFFPYMKRMMDLAHEAGALVDTHSDGAVREILPDLIEMGTNILNPIQWRCTGMDREGLKRDFGDRLVFEGAMDNQYTVPFGTVEEVRQEVRDNIRILGEGGGFILTPCHNIQVVGPPENVVAMYDTAYEEGWM